ncbi:NupC/NupG family nucleoside CNT transporter [Pelagicoccus albus]|uniref:Na+ dependent nucleoside transporter n=1 Tax=Pelagicoccus albus TaxID=415222 RepID=A0A7X1B8M9_9BACT|nr:nucleoside transporter C-terminal domain-containing protein [Pelagicoccus albus]MBC2607592.1 Na+ dependent nucleoside transporter [Pelagicoccus albus]
MDMLYSLFRALIGIVGLLALCWWVSEDRKRINWRLIGAGLLLQFVLAVLILKVSVFRNIVASVSGFFSKLIGFSDDGASMVFGSMPTDIPVFGIAWTVLSTIVFFSAFSAILYHLRILQVMVFAFAWLLSKALKLSGAECLASAANVFIGQTEAPLVIKPYLKSMTRSEINSLMTGGMATIAGGVLALYMSTLGGGDETAMIAFGKHLLTASILSAPAAMVAAKIIAPQTEKVEGQLAFPKNTEYESVLDAATKGTSDGLMLALNVGAMLVAFTALVALLNYVTGTWIGEWTGLNAWVASITDGKFSSFDFSFVVGVISAPFAWLLGVANSDLLVVGQLLGERIVFNELYAYFHFAELKDAGVITDEKSILILTYALCGFANIASIGIQVGGISALEKSQRPNLLRYGFKALIGGMVACYLTAVVASTIQSTIL